MNRYYASDFEPEASRGLLIFIGVIVSLCSLCIGTVMGYEFRDWQQRIHEANKPLPVRKSAQNPPPSLYPCTTEGRYEYDRTCRAQRRMTQIGAGK